MRSQQHKLPSQVNQIIYRWYDTKNKHFQFTISTANQTNQSQNTLRKMLSYIHSEVKCITLVNVPASYKIANMIIGFRFPRLECLRLRNCQMREADIRALVEKQWTLLKELTLSHDQIGDEIFQIIHNYSFQNRLEKMGLQLIGVTSNGFRNFHSFNFSNLKQAHFPYLVGNKLGKTGVLYLVKTKLPQLKYLNLAITELTNESIKHLCKAEWANLKMLKISQNHGLTADCLDYFDIVNWKLQKLRTSLINKLSIHYFSSVVRLQSGYELKIQINLQENELVEGKDAFLNANVILSYDY